MNVTFCRRTRSSTGRGRITSGDEVLEADATPGTPHPSDRTRLKTHPSRSSVYKNTRSSAAPNERRRGRRNQSPSLAQPEDSPSYLFIPRNRILPLSITEHKSIRRFYFAVNWANEKSRVFFIFRSRAFDDCRWLPVAGGAFSARFRRGRTARAPLLGGVFRRDLLRFFGTSLWRSALHWIQISLHVKVMHGMKRLFISRDEVNNGRGWKKWWK